MRINCSQRNSGFTLVELLVVIAIISILAGTAIMIINPTQLQRKANEVKLKSNVTKLCSALFACANVKDTPAECDTFNKLGVQDLSQPPTFGYGMYPDGTGNILYIYGSFPASGCVYNCGFNFQDGTPFNVYVTGTCL